MDPQQALILGQALVAAAQQAIADGVPTVDLSALSESVVDDALADLQAAIARKERGE